VAEIENTILSRNFMWHFSRNITDASVVHKDDNRFGFGYSFFRDANPYNFDINFHVVKPIPFIFAAVKILPADFRIKVARAFLQTPSPGLIHNDPHVDGPYPHTVLLYYVNDSDGDTVFFDSEDKTKIIERVTPKRGRVLLFDGSMYHASCPPSNGYRSVVNFNIVSPEHFKEPE
jgi:hypothetical protein